MRLLLGHVPCFSLQRLVLQRHICNRGSAQACPSKVLEHDVDFLQTHTGLETLSLGMLTVDQWGFDFEVALARTDHVMHCRNASTVSLITLSYAVSRTICSIPSDDPRARPSCLQGLTHLTKLTRLDIGMNETIHPYPLSVVARLTTLQVLCIPPPRDPSHLSALK
jgi:hypothetical protein